MENEENSTPTVFELVDDAGDNYDSLGLFQTLEEAIAEATAGTEPRTECDEYVKLEIRERAFGFHGLCNTGMVVATVEWSQYFHEEGNEWRWFRPLVTRLTETKKEK